MSEFIRRLNAIKTRWDPAWLTPSQQQCLIELQAALRVPGSVNLFGKHGVGKTFLAWVLARESDLIYFPHLALLEQAENTNADGVIIDNCLPGRIEHREVLKLLRFRGIKRSILITTELIHDYTYQSELILTPADLQKVRDNLETVGIYVDAFAEGWDLWRLLNPFLRQGASAL